MERSEQSASKLLEALHESQLKLAQKEELLEALKQLSQDILSSLDLETVLQTAVKFIGDTLNVTSVYINRWDEAAGTLTAIADYYGPRATEKERIPDLGVPYNLELEFGLPPKWLYEPEGKFVTHFDDPDIAPGELAHFLAYDGKTVAEIPLVANGQPIGTLEFWESGTKRIYSDAELDLAVSIAPQIALAINNAMLYEQAKATSHLKTELLRKVSHEFRTPLNAIIGFSEMLQEGVYGSLTEKQHEKLAAVGQSAGHLLQLVGELLDQSALEIGRLQLTEAHFSLLALITSIEPQLRLAAEKKALDFAIVVSSYMPDTLYGDQARLRQIIVNLISNGIKYTEQGFVRVKIDLLDRQRWMISVADSGIGISPEFMDNLFEPFRQADDSTTRRYEGSGLGLSIVKELVTLMSGEISVDSVVGEGSKFCVTLPLQA